jgi:hypothetical protein
MRDAAKGSGACCWLLRWNDRGRALANLQAAGALWHGYLCLNARLHSGLRKDSYPCKQGVALDCCQHGGVHLVKCGWQRSGRCCSGACAKVDSRADLRMAG